MRICARCTKDACNNHLCEKCLRCSDCCECEVTLSEQPPNARSVMPKHEAVAAPEPWIDDEPEEGKSEEPESKALAAEAPESEALGDETPESGTLVDKPPEDEASKPPGT